MNRYWGRTDGRRLEQSVWAPTIRRNPNGTIIDPEQTFTNLNPGLTIFSEDGKAGFSLRNNRQGILVREQIKPGDSEECFREVTHGPVLQLWAAMAPDGTVLASRFKPKPGSELETNPDGTWSVIHLYPQEPRSRQQNLELRVTYDYDRTVCGGLPSRAIYEEYHGATRVSKSEVYIEKLVLGQPLAPGDLDWRAHLPPGVPPEDVPLIPWDSAFVAIVDTNTWTVTDPDRANRRTQTVVWMGRIKWVGLIAVGATVSALGLAVGMGWWLLRRRKQKAPSSLATPPLLDTTSGPARGDSRPGP